MHPLALTSYPRRAAVTRSRSSRRRARRAAIAVVVGLLGAGAGQAYADPPQHKVHQHLPGSHANVRQQTVTRSTDVVPGARQSAPVTGGRAVPADSPSDNGVLDDWPAAALIALLAAVLGVVAVVRRRRLPTTT